MATMDIIEAGGGERICFMKAVKRGGRWARFKVASVVINGDLLNQSKTKERGSGHM